MQIDISTYFLMRHFAGDEVTKSLRESFEVGPCGKANITPLEGEFLLNKNDDYSSLLREQKPFVIRGGANDWDCTKKWCFDSFKEKFGDQDVLIDRQDHSILEDFKKHQVITREKLSHFIDTLDNGPDRYLRFAPFIQNNPILENDLNLSWLNSLKRWHHQGPLYHFFLGPKGSRSRLHCANSDNFFIQVRGKKNWLLLEPKNHFFVHPQNYRSALNFESDIDLRNTVDTSRFPLSGRITGHSVTCDEGDILYIPPYYWHDVINETASLGVSVRYISALTGIKAAPLLFLLNLLGNNPSVFNMKLNDKLNESLYQRETHGH